MDDRKIGYVILTFFSISKNFFVCMCVCMYVYANELSNIYLSRPGPYSRYLVTPHYIQQAVHPSTFRCRWVAGCWRACTQSASTLPERMTLSASAAHSCSWWCSATGWPLPRDTCWHSTYIHNKYIIGMHTYIHHRTWPRSSPAWSNPRRPKLCDHIRNNERANTYYIHSYIHTQLTHTLTDLSSTTAAADPAAGFLPCCFFSAAAFSSASRFFASFAIFSSSIACTHRHNYVHAYIHT